MILGLSVIFPLMRASPSVRFFIAENIQLSAFGTSCFFSVGGVSNNNKSDNF